MTSCLLQLRRVPASILLAVSGLYHKLPFIRPDIAVLSWIQRRWSKILMEETNTLMSSDLWVERLERGSKISKDF